MQKPITVKVVNKAGLALPAYASAGAAGMDVRANLPEPLILEPMQRSLVPTGLYLSIPAGYEAQVRPRSGLAIKNGITCLNTPGTIDSDYRGEVGVILINFSSEPQTIHHGDRIAQMVFQQVTQAKWLPVEILDESDRGSGGFGHTGKQ